MLIAAARPHRNHQPRLGKRSYHKGLILQIINTPLFTTRNNS